MKRFYALSRIWYRMSFCVFYKMWSDASKAAFCFDRLGGKWYHKYPLLITMPKTDISRILNKKRILHTWL